jgi:tetratricopeptide (TPR) repeat protein/tRNA A-37 threonylcarbamoyl transferase component Bud32
MERSETGEETLVPSPSDSATLRPSAEVSSTDSGIPRGRMIGRFVVLDRIGRGGMGVVYLAYDPQLERRVALKLVHREIAGDETSAARLLREAQALAKVAHPNVVAIHDVGRVDEGIYVAMEFIDGVSLGAWVRAAQRRVDEIVAVFVAAGEGIAAAHDAGLVHRDIKPDNIMIGRDGRVRVLDFGLARAAASTSAPGGSSDARVHGRGIDVSLTSAGAVMGTPVYMAPEQYAGGEVDARTDVYALCLSLWEAIDGDRPFAGNSLPELAANVTMGHMRSSALPRAPRWLRAVLLRGMARVPDERYPTMRALLAELTRDRMRRLRLGGLVIAAAGAVALAATALAEPAQCIDADDALVGIWDRERRAATTAAFEASDKPWARPSLATVTRALDDYATQIASSRHEACVATRIHGTQSEALLDRRMACLDRRASYLDGLVDALIAGRPEAIEHAVEAALGLPRVDGCSDSERLLREPSLPEDAPTRDEVAAIRRELDALEMQIRAGTYEGLNDRLTTLEARARGTAHEPVLAEVLLVRGRWERRQGQPDPASEHLLGALAHATTSGHDNVAVQAATGLVLVEGGLRDRFDVAEVYAALAMSLLARLGEAPQLRVELLSSMGQLESSRGRNDRAIELLSEAMALERSLGVQGDHSPFVLRAMARVLIFARRFDEAERTLDEMTSLVAARFGPDHPDAALALTATAQLRTAQDRPEEALVALARAREILIAAYGPDHVEVAAAQNSIGRALSELRRDAEAAQAYGGALQIIERALGPEHHNVATGLANLAAVQTRMGRGDLAVPALRRALAIRIAKFGEIHDMVGKTLDLLGEALLSTRDPTGAREAFEQALRVFEALGGPTDRRLARSLEGLATLADAQGDTTAAQAYRARAAAVKR